MPYLINIILSTVIMLAAVNIPAHYLDLSKYFSHPNFGGTFTTLSGANTVSSFPTTYNNNLTLTPNLTTANTFTTGLQSFVNSSSTQASFSGLTWFGSTNQSNFSATGALTLGTALTVANGGTGSTTLSAGQVLLGNGTGNVSTPSGWGNSGQFLTSGGAGVNPSWTTAAVDQTASYNWTGNYFGIKNLNASSTAAQPITLNTLTYNTPSVRAASSTALFEDGSGNLTWNPETWVLLVSTTTQQAMRYATTTISSAVSTTSQDIRIVYDNPGATSGVTSYVLNFNSDAGANYGLTMTSTGGNLGTSIESGVNLFELTGGNTSTTSPAYFDIRVKNVTANVKRMKYDGVLNSSATAAPSIVNGGGVWNNTGTGITTITIGSELNQTIPSGAIIRIYASGR